MKAWVLHDIGDIRYEDREIPKPAPGEVLVEVKAVGVCGSDIPRIYKTGAHRMPLIPGHEFAGQIVEYDDVAGGSDKAVSEDEPSGSTDAGISKRVGVFPLIPCRTCDPCKKGLYEMCRNYDYIGSRRDGAFAEYVSVPKDNLIELPDEVSYEEAAMLEPMAVAVHAMRRGLLGYGMSDGRVVGSEAPGDKTGTAGGDHPVIAVCGLGTIGLLLTMFLIDAGYKDIYVIGNKEFQKRKAVSLGISEDHYIDSRSDSEKMKSLYGRMDVFFECVGKNECVSLAMDMAAPAGTVVLVGNPASDMTLERDNYWKILRNQLRIVGTWNSSFRTGGDDWSYVIDRLKSGYIHPAELITHKLQPGELESGLVVMRDKTGDYCKVMISRR